ncbi:hypothetical protein [Candidatus Entotheonella palauensis]|uniref:Alginate export domain-containing protein n=1 Tax=Candidatus Entotheonella gemina TaxID=1429439 RepID=W4MH82_9BACT|nr:hypothetical protein [Candidatus Entotheonella palauensis]ETX09067.1 MAG: hypothetical protein ETSY2_01625 [Candidatus Entotheonella gemina]
MLKRSVSIGLICALALSMAVVAGAQQAPVPVVRMGNAIELGDDLWVDFGGGAELRFQFSHNPDFESDIQDRPPARATHATTPHGGTSDIWFLQAQLSADAQYKKHLRFQVMMRATKTIDGNRIDDGFSDIGDSPANRVFDTASDRNLDCGTEIGQIDPDTGEVVRDDDGEVETVAVSDSGCTQRNTWNLERMWIDYQLQGTPLRFRLGADFWTHDEAALVADDDVRAAVYATFGDLELHAAVVLNSEAQRIGLSNDNDRIYYNFRVRYDMKPFRFALAATYHRDRFDQDQETDTILLMPSAAGSLGIISGMVQPMFNFGSVDANDGIDYDVKSFGFIGIVRANLAGGKIRPFLGFVYGTGDDDPNDDDLEGFFVMPFNEIAPYTASSHFSVYNRTQSGGARDVQTPALANIGSGFEFLHTVANPFHDRPGNDLHAGVDSTYSNPGTIHIAPGVTVDLTKGHRVSFMYIYRALTDSELIEQELLDREEVATDVDKSMTHELAVDYQWTPSPYFDLRLFGSAMFLGNGGKDIAEAQDCDEATDGLQPCSGEDVALHGEIRVRARF